MNPHERKVIKGIIHKRCPRCHQWRPETEFHKETQRWDFRQGYCKQCKADYMSEYHQRKKGE